MSRVRRWALRAAIAAALAGLGAAAVGIGVGAWLVSPAGNDFLAPRLVAFADDQIPGHVALGRLRTEVGARRVVLDGLALQDAAGTPLVTLGHVEATVDPWALLDGTLALPTVDLTDVDATITVGRDGRVAIVDALGVDPSWITQLPGVIQIGALTAKGKANLDLAGYPIPVDALDARLAARVDHALTVTDLRLDARIPHLRDPIAVAGGLAFDGGLTLDALTVATGPTQLGVTGTIADLFHGGGAALTAKLDAVDAASVPALDPLGLTVHATGSATVDGPWRALRATLTADGPAHVAATAGVDLTDPTWPFTASAGITDADAHVVAPIAPAGTMLSGQLDVTGALPVDGPVAHGTFDGDARALGLRFPGLTTTIDADLDGLRLSDGHLAGPAGEVTFAATAAPWLAPVVTADADARLHLGALGPVGVPDGLAGEADARVHLAGPLLSEGADVTAEIAVADVAFRGLTVPTATIDARGRLDPRLALTATAAVAAPTVDGKGLALQDLAAPLDVTWAPGAALIARGSGIAGHASFAAWADVDGARADLSLTAAPRAPLRAEAVVTLPNPRASGFRLGDVVANATLVGDDAHTRVSVALPDLPPVDVVARVDLARNALIVDALTLTPPEGPVWTLAAPATATLAPSGLTDLDARVVSSRGEARLTGGLGWDGLDVHVHATGLDPNAVGDWLPALGLPGLEGRLSVDADVRGSDALSADATFFAAGVGLRAGPGDLEIEGTAHLTDDVARVEAAVAHGNTPIATITAGLPVRVERAAIRLDADAPVTADLVVADVPIPDLVEIVRSEPLSTLARRWIDGSVGGEVHLTGPIATPKVAGRVGGRVLGPAGWVNADGVVSGGLDKVVLRAKAEADDLGRLGGAEVIAETGAPALLAWALGDGPRPADLGDPAFWLPNASAELEAKRLPLRTVLALLALDGDVGGTADARLAIAGRGFEFVPTLALTLHDAQFGDETTMTRGMVSLDDAGALDGAFDFRYARPVKRGRKKLKIDEGGIALRGTVPLHVTLDEPPKGWFDEPLDVAITGRGVPIAVARALDGDIVDAEGWLALGGTVRGTPRAPDLDLHARLDDGSLRYRRLGIRAEDVHVQVDVVGDEVHVVDASLVTRPARRALDPWLGGREGIVAHGHARIGEFDLVDLDLEATVDHALVLSRRDQTARVSTTTPLHVAGRATHPVITGAIRVDQADVALDKGTLMEVGLWSPAPSELDPRIRVVRGGEAEVREVAAVRPFWAFVDADVHVDLGQDTQGGLALPYLGGFGGLAAEASTIEAEGVLAGSVDVRAADGVAQVDGRVDVVSGEARVMKSAFVLDAGTVTFVDGDPFRPFVIVAGGMGLEGGVNIDLALRGTPTGAEARFRSAQLDTTDQVISAVITGQNPLTGGSNVGVATGLASAVVTRTLFGDLDLGTLQFAGGVLSYTFAPTPRIRITPEIGIGTMFTGDALAIDASWRPTRALTVQAHLGTYRRSVSFEWRRRYGR